MHPTTWTVLASPDEVAGWFAGTYLLYMVFNTIDVLRPRKTNRKRRTLNLAKRIATYLVQNGSDTRLTFRQERRLRKVANRQAKAGRTAKKAREITEIQDLLEPRIWESDLDRSQEIAANETAHIVSVNACATCAATGDDPCVTASGKPARSPHKGRPVLAA